MTLTYTFRDGTTTTDTIEWARKYEDHDYRKVKVTKIDPERQTFVSTIWQGLPSIGDGEPNVYETAYLRDVDGINQMIHFERSWTEEEAITAHEDFVELARMGVLDKMAEAEAERRDQ